jgi:hypothetical protein
LPLGNSFLSQVLTIASLSDNKRIFASEIEQSEFNWQFRDNEEKLKQMMNRFKTLVLGDDFAVLP